MRIRRLRNWTSRAALATLIAFAPVLAWLPPAARAQDAEPAAAAAEVKAAAAAAAVAAEKDRAEKEAAKAAAAVGANKLAPQAASNESAPADPAAKATETSDAKKPADDKAAAKVGREESKVGVGEQLSFREEKVAEEMKELEDRMFRLAESLKSHEPENSSRLMLGLKYAREELILHQMAEVKAALARLDLSEASVEQKQLLAKLERLQDLLLSPDLDFQMKLERLRQIREILRQLDGAIKEEDREQKGSADLAEKEQQLEQLRKRDQPNDEKELEELTRQREDLERKLAAEKFQVLKKDQEGNRRTTDSIGDLVRTLGDSGAGALGELIRASGSMSSAEGGLGSLKAGDASQDQMKALESLKYAKSQLEDEAEKLLDELRGEVKKRVMEALTIMLEKQIAIRESTVSLGPRVKEGSRQALASVAGLAKSEAKIIEIASDLITLVEETEFGIALPAALSVVRDEMDGVRTSLAAADASEAVVAAERQVEEDLKGLLDAMKRMPASRGQGNNERGSPGEQERELNRLIAELKMIRLLQVRLNGDTGKVDDGRPAAVEELSTALRRQINALEDRQDNIFDVTERLGAERGTEISQ